MVKEGTERMRAELAALSVRLPARRRDPIEMLVVPCFARATCDERADGLLSPRPPGTHVLTRARFYRQMARWRHMPRTRGSLQRGQARQDFGRRMLAWRTMALVRRRACQQRA